jgi:hypothetical protein
MKSHVRHGIWLQCYDAVHVVYVAGQQDILSLVYQGQPRLPPLLCGVDPRFASVAGATTAAASGFTHARTTMR